jgi:competence protein ComEA
MRNGRNGWSKRIAIVALVLAGTICLAQSSGTEQNAAAGKPAQTVSQKIAASQSLLDINTATPGQLTVLPGVGDVYAKRIIDGRPYTAKNQLVQRGILPQNTYDKIKDQIIAHRPKSSGK